jgi:hypothetical protein
MLRPSTRRFKLGALALTCPVVERVPAAVAWLGSPGLHVVGPGPRRAAQVASRQGGREQPPFRMLVLLGLSGGALVSYDALGCPACRCGADSGAGWPAGPQRNQPALCAKG